MPGHEKPQSQYTLPGFEDLIPAAEDVVPPEIEPARYIAPTWDKEPNATERWHKESGGGRRDTDMVDPPERRWPQTRPHHSHRGGRSYPERSGRDVVREMTDAADKKNPNRGVPKTRAAQVALAKVKLASETREANGDITRQIALNRSRSERHSY